MVILQIDEHQVQRVEEATDVLYRKAVKPFVYWLIREQIDPVDCEELDEICVEYNNLPQNKELMTLGKFGTLLSAICHALPAARGHLPWSSSVALGWNRVLPPVKTAPLPRWLSWVYGVDFAEQGHPAAGLMCLIQQRNCIRPGETCRIRPEDIAWDPLLVGSASDPRGTAPGSASKTQSSEPGYQGATIIRLGDKTKAGRPQVVIFRKGEAPELLQRLKNLAERTPRGTPVISITYKKYRQLFLNSTASSF